MRAVPALALALASLLDPAAPALAGEDLLADGDFPRWKDGLPEGWTPKVGATTGSPVESEVAPGPEGGVSLRGGPSTGRWRILARGFEAKAGTAYRLSFEARGTGLRLDPRQFDNAYVGVSLPAEPGRGPDRRLVTVREGPWSPEEILFRPAAAGPAEVWIFLSRTGTLEVRRLALEVLGPEDSYDALVRNMGRYYSHFASKGIDWEKAAAAHRAKALAAKDPAAFAEAVRDLLAGLKDLHVTIRGPDGRVLPTWVRSPERNHDFRAVAGELAEPRPIGRMALAGAAGKDLGYLAVFSLPGDEAAFAPVVAALEGMLDRRGILLDVRGNGGGDERRSLALASFFAKGPVVYARTLVRSGPKPTDLSGPVDRVLTPWEGRRFDGPVVVLTGPGCVSSGEGLAQMMAAIPGVVLAGKPTGGSSGNPAPADLPDGVTVFFSRWVDLLPDGSPLEGRGVPPDREIPHEGPGDPTFAAGLAILEEMAAKAGR